MLAIISSEMKGFRFNLLKSAMVCMGIFFGTGTGVGVAQATDEKLDVPLVVAALISERDQLLLSKFVQMREKYLEGLDTYRKAWSKEDRIKDALAALELKSQLEERKSFGAPLEKTELLRGELKRVVDTWNAKSSRSRKAANEALKEMLQAARLKAIKSGDLLVVKAIDAQLKQLTPPAQQKEAAEEPAKEDDDTLPLAWDWESGGVLQLLPDGTARHTRWGGAMGKWKWTRKGRKIDLTHPNKTLFRIELNRDGSGDVISQYGVMTTITPHKKDAEPE